MTLFLNAKTTARFSADDENLHHKEASVTPRIYLHFNMQIPQAIASPLSDEYVDRYSSIVPA